MDFFSKFKKTDEATNPASDDQDSSYATETSAATDPYNSSSHVIKGSADATDPVGSYGDDTEEGDSKKPSYGGATTGTDEYGEDMEGGYAEKPSYGGAATGTDEYEEDTEESFLKKPTYGDEYGGDKEESLAKNPTTYGGFSTGGTDEYEKPEGTETGSYGKYDQSTEEDFSYTPSTGADSGEAGYVGATESYIKKPSGGIYGGATTGDYASDDKYNE